MYQISNFMDNDDINMLANAGPFTVIEYERDLSVMPSSAAAAYFCSKMNVRKRQVVCDLSKANVTVQAGAMQWMLGNVNATTGINTLLLIKSKKSRMLIPRGCTPCHSPKPREDGMPMAMASSATIKQESFLFQRSLS